MIRPLPKNQINLTRLVILWRAFGYAPFTSLMVARLIGQCTLDRAREIMAELLRWRHIEVCWIDHVEYWAIPSAYIHELDRLERGE